MMMCIVFFLVMAWLWQGGGGRLPPRRDVILVDQDYPDGITDGGSGEVREQEEEDGYYDYLIARTRVTARLRVPK